MHQFLLLKPDDAVLASRGKLSFAGDLQSFQVTLRGLQRTTDLAYTS